jgi:hypothetical protein
MIICGLDISTSYIGYTILEDGKFKSIGHLDLTKCETLYVKLKQFLDLIATIDADLFFVEAPAMAYAMTTAHTISILQRFNGFCCSAIFIKKGIEPKLLSAVDCRKLCGIKIPKGVKKKEAKKYLLELVKSKGVVPEDAWKYKKTGTPKDWCFDQADAFIVATAGNISLKS